MSDTTMKSYINSRVDLICNVRRYSPLHDCIASLTTSRFNMAEKSRLAIKLQITCQFKVMIYRSSHYYIY